MYQVTVTPQFLSGKDTFRQAVPALSWAVLIFATFILMCVLSLYISPFFAVSVIIVGLADSFLIFFDLFTDHIPIGITLINSSRNGITRIYKSNTHIKINVAKNGEIYKDNIKLNLSYSVPKDIVYIDNGHRSGKFKFYTLSFSAIITGNEVNGFIDFCLKNNVRFLV